MSDIATQRDITTVPKVELHVHLNGSITEANASTLARRHGADPATALRLTDGRYPGRSGPPRVRPDTPAGTST
jgi:hypothetical protein